jgi:hypothetical protein
MQNEFSPPQNMLHRLFLSDLRYMLLLAYEIIFFRKKNDSWGHIENPRGVQYCAKLQTVSSDHFYSSKKLKLFSLVFLTYSLASRTIRDLLLQIERLWERNSVNRPISSAWACVTIVTRLALLQDFDSSRRHPSGREVYLTCTLKKSEWHSKNLLFLLLKTV